MISNTFEHTCSSSVLKLILITTNNILNLIYIIVPILLIISLTYLFIKKMQNPEEKKINKKISNACISAAIIFFIPLLINITISMLGEKSDIKSCLNNIKETKYEQPIIEDENKNRKNIIGNPNDYEKGEKKKETTSNSSNNNNNNSNNSSIIDQSTITATEGGQKIIQIAEQLGEKIRQDGDWTYGGGGVDNHQFTCGRYVSYILYQAGYVEKGGISHAPSGFKPLYAERLKNVEIINTGNKNINEIEDVRPGDVVVKNSTIPYDSTIAIVAYKKDGEYYYYSAVSENFVKNQHCGPAKFSWWERHGVSCIVRAK